MRKPSFGVTAFAVLTLSLIGVLRVIYEPMLPASPTEYLVTVPASEPIPAPIVEIGWKQSIDQAHLDAKRRKLGLLLVFMDPANTYSKHFELKVFRDPEVARFINRNYVPVKIDLDQYPEWSQVVLPLQRLGRYVEPGVELVVTSQDGNLISHYALDNPFQYYGPEAVIPFLIESKTLLRQATNGSESDQILRIQQLADIQTLALAGGEPIPAFDEFGQRLTNHLQPGELGPLKPGSTKISPLGFRFLAKIGQVQFSSQAMRQLALTPLYDAIDGGFFREARSTKGSSTIDTGKSSVQNALCAQVVAQLSCASHDRDLRALAIDIGNDVVNDFLEGDSISTSRLNDQSVDSRSRRSSLTDNRLHSLLNSADSRSFLSFVSKQQSPDQDLVSLTDISVLSNPDFIRVRQTIRERLQVAPGLSEPDHIAVDGYLAARLFELFRYTSDERFLRKARQISEQVYSALADNQVAKIYGNRQLGLGWLGSYLAVADCGLAQFAATGEIYPLRSGELALRLAIEKFKSGQTGLLNNVAPDRESNFAFSPQIPDLADHDRESMNAQVIRLTYGYSIAAEHEKSRAGFLAFSQSVLARLNPVMHKANPLAAGYFDAAFDVIEDSAVVITGPNRVEMGNRLAKKQPMSVIYPMTESHAPTKDLLFIRHGSRLDGPFTEAEIQKKMTQSSRVESQ